MLENMMPLVENFTGDRPKILIVEDDAGTAELLQDYLRDSLSAEPHIAASAQEALDMDDEDPAEVILVDVLLPDMDGLELLAALGAKGQRPVILMTGHPTLGRAIEAMRLGATDMLVKPFDMDKVGRTIVGAVGKYRRDQLRVQRLVRVRELSKKVIQERRSLRQKMDLLCRDVVGAYRELAEKLIKLDK